MKKTKSQNYTLDTIYYCFAKLLERTSYYGLRAMLVLYMLGETLKMNSKEAIAIYTWFITAIIFSQIIGALFGDLLIGNKKAIIIGGVIEALGAFILCTPSIYGLYTGLFLIVLGNGFFAPNIISNYGKSCLNKPKLLDAGFAALYLSINLGALLGALLISFLVAKLGYTVGFITSGILTLLALVPILIVKNNTLQEGKKVSIEKRILAVVTAFVIVGLFWGVYEVSSIRISDLQLKLSEISTLEIPLSIWRSLDFVFILPVSLIATIVWAYFYTSSSFKLLMGFLFGTIAFAIVLMIPDMPQENHAIYFLLSLLLLAISEIHIVPIIYSISTKYSNPKYLAILISLVIILGKIFGLVSSLFYQIFNDYAIVGLKFGILAMLLVSMVLLAYFIIDKKVIIRHK